MEKEKNILKNFKILKMVRNLKSANKKKKTGLNEKDKNIPGGQEFRKTKKISEIIKTYIRT